MHIHLLNLNASLWAARSYHSFCQIFPASTDTDQIAVWPDALISQQHTWELQCIQVHYMICLFLL